MGSVYVVKDSVHVRAPLERCFLLSTSVDLVGRTLGLRAVKGKTTGLVVGGDRVTWRGWKFGLPVWHETIITEYERPGFFQDQMLGGLFATFRHDHHFSEVDGMTLMLDRVRFSLPLWKLGKMVSKKVLVPHITHLLRHRMEMLKTVAESGNWEDFLPPGQGSVASEEMR